MVSIVAVLVLGAAAGGFYLSGSTRSSVTTTTTVTSTVTTTQLLTSTYTATFTSVLAGPVWLSVGAYANYSGFTSSFGRNYTEHVTIEVIQFNKTNIEYQIAIAFPSGFVNSNSTKSVTTQWLGMTESPAKLLCEGLGERPSLANLTVSGNTVSAIAYECSNGNDYGSVYLGTNVPFVLALSHHSTVSSYSETWVITTTDIPGLL